MEKKYCYSVFITAWAILLIGCGAPAKIQVADYSQLATCHQVNTFDFNSVKPKPINELNIDSLLLHRFSASSLNIAHAFGFLNLLDSFVRYNAAYHVQPGAENQMKKTEAAMRLSDRINLASLEISSFAAELDCEEERITQVADFLKGKEKQRETRLTVAAIGVGAIGGVASGILSGNENAGNSGDYLGIATGITEAILGVLILKNSKKTELLHQRNALNDIWYGSDASEIYPPSIWYYLNYKNPQQPDALSLREKIIERWKGFQQVNVHSPEDQKEFESLYLAAKGKYDSDGLYNRAKMYDQIESYVKMIKQELSILSLEISREP